jgi:hypothetical protein
MALLDIDFGVSRLLAVLWSPWNNQRKAFTILVFPVFIHFGALGTVFNEASYLETTAEIGVLLLNGNQLD